MAHNVFMAATTALRDVKRPSTSTMPVIDDDVKAQAAIDHLTAICAQASIKGRPASPADLFQPWDKLTTRQQAIAAWSVLGYGKLIPQMIENGQKCIFLMVGQSRLDVEPGHAERPNAWGRGQYAGRGLGGNPMIIGIEFLEQSANGHADNVVTHEFGHVAQRALFAALEKFEHDRPLTQAESQRATFAGEMENLYAELFRRSSNQTAPYDYSLHNVAENNSDALAATQGGLVVSEEARLAMMNPHQWEYCRRFINAFGDYPPGLAPPIMTATSPPKLPNLFAAPGDDAEQIAKELVAIDVLPPSQAHAAARQKQRLTTRAYALTPGPKVEDNRSWSTYFLGARNSLVLPWDAKGNDR